ncbi:hypothetical protein OG401_30900 [Kitasatospora purpeofusca]|nr:hypothetical protein [Kitasatospora purpeofusca]MCX4688655.1 hypothetical protein [Kitasatospora purpeofusca]
MTPGKRLIQLRLASVLGPYAPSSSSPLSRWKPRTAAVVAGPVRGCGGAPLPPRLL